MWYRYIYIEFSPEKAQMFPRSILLHVLLKIQISAIVIIPSLRRRVGIIQLLTRFEDNSSFVWDENGSVARSSSLRATDPFEGGEQNCCCPRSQCITVLSYTFVFYKIYLFTLSTHISIRWFQYSHPSSPRIFKTHRHVDGIITWLI